MALRGVIVFFVGLVMVRVAAKRFLSHKTAFDAILFFILASMLSRAVNGSAAFFPTLGVGFLLAGLHRLVAIIAFHHHGFGILVKGRDTLLIKDGQAIPDALRRHHLTEEDLHEELRINGAAAPSAVRESRFERSGEISVVKK